jgi:5-formyltetrahydrofolate cyclo-ligase
MLKDDIKKQFRVDSLQKLKKISKSRKYYCDKFVINQLYLEIKKENFKQIMLYLPLDIEVNIYPLINRLRKEGKLLFVPFMKGKSFKLVKYRLPLKRKNFGIKEPKNSYQYRKKQIDLSIVPIVGIDSTFRRIGFGKGMYDRFFEKNINRVVFVARRLCYSKDIITNDYDILADNIVIY